ncbi:MAG TPA: C40 family peptidase [Streptosporangiaceae bacterium]|jgi:cell wall-associated NlpC family hydrolase|nr:C40 family peptidase [Streptosporangiaceae bacterium]
MVPGPIAEGSKQVRMRGARRSVLTLGAGLAVLTTTAAGNVPAALAAPRTGLDPAPLPPGAGSDLAGPVVPGALRPVSQAIAVSDLSGSSRLPMIAPLHGLLQADLLVVAPTTLRSDFAAAVRRMRGVVAAEQVDAARIQVNGKFTAMLGVDPSRFRAFAPRQTAQSARLWQNVAIGAVAVSYTMGKLDKLPLDRPVRVAGRHAKELPVAGFGTVGIAGVDAVVSDAVARSLGIPAGNAIVISAPHADLNSLMKQIRKLLPRDAAIAPLVTQTSTSTAAPAAGTNGTGTAGAGAAGAAGVSSAYGPGLSRVEVIAFLTAAEGRLGLPYVWGGNGPSVFDCSGLVQWSLAQAGVAMPRVAADQARTGPQVPLSQLQPGDLLFYHTDPTAPGYISHVAIYIGAGEMIQAPEPGLNVEIVPADFGSEFAGAVAVYPRVAATVAANPAG